LIHYETFKEEVKEIPRSASDDAQASSEAPESAPAAETTSTSTTTSTSGIMADVALETLVENTLKGARELSIGSLLEGFSYGL
jgi:hypothetical protein